MSAGRRFDRGGAVIGGELITAGESVNVADMAQHRGDDDRTDAVEVGEGGFGGGDDAGDPPFGRAQLLIDVASNS